MYVILSPFFFWGGGHTYTSSLVDGKLEVCRRGGEEAGGVGGLAANGNPINDAFYTSRSEKGSLRLQVATYTITPFLLRSPLKLEVHHVCSAFPWRKTKRTSRKRKKEKKKKEKYKDKDSETEKEAQTKETENEKTKKGQVVIACRGGHTVDANLM